MRTDFMSGEEVVRELKSGSQLSQAVSVIHEAYAIIETASNQRRPITQIEVRNIEFDAALRIAALLGVDLAHQGPGDAEGANT